MIGAAVRGADLFSDRQDIPVGPLIRHIVHQ
jgi:hypothetical protein